MPRTPIEPRFKIEYLSILDSEGNLDTALEPAIPPDDLKRLYRAMVLGRRLDERMVRLQREGRIGPFAPIKGQEAAQIGSVFALRRTDWMVPSFRETAAMLWRGWALGKPAFPLPRGVRGGPPVPGGGAATAGGGRPRGKPPPPLRGGAGGRPPRAGPARPADHDPRG